MSNKRTIFVLIRIGTDRDTLSRVRESIPKVKSVIASLSDNEYKLAFSTVDASCSGYLMKTDCSLQKLRKELFNSVNPPLLNDDSYLAFEVGGDFDGVGFSQAWSWLQHH